jgi:hypothetical protein
MSRSHTGRQYEPHIQDGESADALIAGSVDDLERSQSRRSAVVDPRPRDYDRHGERCAGFLYRRQGTICDRSLSRRSTRNIRAHERQGAHPSPSDAIRQPDLGAGERTDRCDRRLDGRDVGAQTSDRFSNIVFYIRESLDVAGYEGATYVNLLAEASADRPCGKSIDIRLFPTLDNVFADLSGGLDAATAASSLSAFALEQNPALNFEIVADYEAADRANAGSAIGVAKGNEAFQFNAAYSGMLADGSAAVIFTKWS